mmetsp:Transcript_5527/g.18548  ORF Transcript_5527/g.18548 Transcript_5527/m.18548 type:complete len:255 (-) Transcript_5527:176-940(-)
MAPTTGQVQALSESAKKSKMQTSSNSRPLLSSTVRTSPERSSGGSFFLAEALRTITTWFAPISPSPMSSAASIISATRAGSVSGSRAGGGPPKWPTSSSSRSSEFGKRRVTRPTSALAAPRMPACVRKLVLSWASFGLPPKRSLTSVKRKPTPRVMVCAVSPQMKKPSSSADVSCSSASSAMVRSCTSSMTTLCSGEWRRGCVLRWKTRSHTSYRPFFFFFLRYSSKASYAAGRIAGSSGDCLLASARYSSRER